MSKTVQSAHIIQIDCVCAQDDVVMGMLTVKENLHFSAALRLPSSVSVAEREDRVENVVSELGLQHCANTKVRFYSSDTWRERVYAWV